jgi:hypothetical protein
MELVKPPATIALRYCTECGRTNQSQTIGSLSHFYEGHKCDGEVRVAIYRLSGETAGEGL